MSRFQHLRQAMIKGGLEGLLVTHMPDIRYLCGFTGSSGVLAVENAGRAALFVDGRYTSQAKSETKGASVSVAAAVTTAAANWIKPRARTIGFDESHLTVAQLRALRKDLRSGGSRPCKLVPAGEMLQRLRQRKDASEIEKISRAVRLGSSLFEIAVKAIRPGVAETRVAAELEYAARQAGAEGMSFDTIVAAGMRSSLPHGTATRNRIPARGFVVLDFGVILAGYCSDMTRTVHVGQPSRKMRAVYEAVLNAQCAAISAVRAGVATGDVDAAARGVLQKAGLGKYFTHSTGHGVGLEIHEAPRIAKGQKQMLEAGMVITVEPGVYIPGQGGVRIEDMVVVTAKGCQVLTPTTKELIVL